MYQLFALNVASSIIIIIFLECVLLVVKALIEHCDEIFVNTESLPDGGNPSLVSRPTSTYSMNQNRPPTQSVSSQRSAKQSLSAGKSPYSSNTLPAGKSPFVSNTVPAGKSPYASNTVPSSFSKPPQPRVYAGSVQGHRPERPGTPPSLSK